MTTFDLEITQVQLKNHTKSHESKLRISDPEWYGIYVQMSGPQCCRCRCHHCHCCLHVTHHCCHPCVTCHCHHCRTHVAVIAVAHALLSLPSLSLLLTGPCWGVTIVIIVIVVIVIVIVISAATVTMQGNSVVT